LAAAIFLVTNLRHFAKNILEKERSVANSLFFESPKFEKKKKNRQKSPQLPTILKGTSDFLLSYFESRQIWLNILKDRRHLSDITKLKKDKKKNTAAASHNLRI